MSGDQGQRAADAAEDQEAAAVEERAADAAEDQEAAAVEERLAVQMQGCELEPEEMAALTAVLTQLQAQGGGALHAAAGAPAGSRDARGPRASRPDRTLARRADLGLWARPGTDQWRRAVGPS